MLFSSVVSISHSRLYWIQVFHLFETNHRVTKLSSSALSWNLPQHSVLKPSRNKGLCRISDRNAHVRPDMQDVPPSMLWVAEISKLRRSIYAAPNQLKRISEIRPDLIRLTRWQGPTPPIFGSSKGARSQGKIVRGHVTSSSAIITMSVSTCGIASQTWIRLLAIGTWNTRMFDESRDFTKVSSLWYLSEVVTRRSR